MGGVGDTWAFWLVRSGSAVDVCELSMARLKLDRVRGVGLTAAVHVYFPLSLPGNSKNLPCINTSES